MLSAAKKLIGRRGYHFSKDTPAPESLSFSLCRISYIPLGDKLVDESVFLIPISKVPAYHIRDRLLSSLWIHLLLFILLFLTYHSLLMKCIVILRHYSYALL